MVRSARLAVVVGLGLLGACTRLVDDPLAVHDVYWGLAPNPTYRGELPLVLFSAPETPAKQGLLYTAMFESEVATQYSGRAAANDDPDDVRSALGEVLYAVDPAEAPDWDAQVGRHRVGLGGRRLRRPPRRRARWRPRSATPATGSPALREAPRRKLRPAPTIRSIGPIRSPPSATRRSTPPPASRRCWSRSMTRAPAP